MFAGYGLPDDLHRRDDMAAVGYERGVSMGGELDADRGGSPAFSVRALRDPSGAALQRLQIVKGWVQDGDAHEQVFDVACSDGLGPDPTTHWCPDNGASVDLSNCAISEDVGDDELGATWRDSGFDAEHHGFYYVRVLETRRVAGRAGTRCESVLHRGYLSRRRSRSAPGPRRSGSLPPARARCDQVSRAMAARARARPRSPRLPFGSDPAACRGDPAGAR